MTEKKKPLTGLFRDNPETSEVDQPIVEYRPVIDFPGYRVGSDGSVWTCWAKRSLGIGKGSHHYISDKWVQKKPYPNTKNGYLYVMLSRGGKKCLRLVHQLVLEAFVGPRPPGMEACHDPNPDRRDCRLENLRWDTRANNTADRKKHGTDCSGDRHYSKIKPEVVPRGVQHHASKIDDDTVRLVRALAAQGVPRKRIAADVGLSEGSVRRIILRQSWAHVT